MTQVRYLMLIIISVGCFNGRAQHIQSSFQLANQLYENAEYANAIEVYKRVLFFDNTGEYGPQIYRNIANCLYLTANYTEAASYYELAYFVEPQDSTKTDIILQKVSCYLLNKDYLGAQEELFILDDNLSPAQQYTRQFYEAMLTFALEDFEESERLFKIIVTDTLQVHELFKTNAKVSKLNPKTAKTLSIIFPGLGQFYAGDIKNGINSMLLTSGLFYLGVRSAINTSFIDAAVSVIPWFQRYYTGGFNKAEAIAIAKKQQRRYVVFNELLNEVEKQ